MNTAQVRDRSRASSSASCQGSSGTKFHLSSHGLSLASSSSRRASTSTAGLSPELWESNTSKFVSVRIIIFPLPEPLAVPITPKADLALQCH
jgi:hypothetical protein